MPNCMIDIIYKIVKTSRLKKLQIIQNINNVIMPQAIIIFSDWILVKQIIVSCTLSAVGGNRFSKKCSLEKRVISFCLRCDDKNLGASFECGGTWVKMPRFNAFSRNVNTINLKIFPTHGAIYTSLRENSESILERAKALRNLWKYETMYSWG